MHRVLKGATHTSLVYDRSDAQATSAAIVEVVAAVRNDRPAHDFCLEHEAFGVYQQVSLSALYLLAAVIAAFFSTHADRFY